MIVRGYDIDTSSIVEAISGVLWWRRWWCPQWYGGGDGVVANYLMGVFNFKGVFGCFHVHVRWG